MSTEIRIPSLGVGMTEGVLTEWIAGDGDIVTMGDVLYNLETDKTVQEIEAPVSGTLRVAAEPGETYAVGTLIGRIE